MGQSRQFCLLFWKNWALAKRSPVRTFFEIAVPLFFILILVILRAFVIKNEQEPPIKYKQFTVNQLPEGLIGENFNLAYGPNTTDVNEVMSKVDFKTLGFNKSKGFGNENEMVDFLLEDNDIASEFLGGVYFESTPEQNNVVYKLRLNSRARNSKTKIKAFGSDPSNSWNTQLTFNSFQIPGPRNKNATHGGPPDYYDEGFLALQNAIDMAILRYRDKNSSAQSIAIKMQRFPYPAYIKDSFILVIQQTLPLFLILSLVFTALCIVRDIVHEKERKLKESMKMMGLAGWMHWLAWFAKYLLILLVAVVFASVLFTIKFSSNGKVLNQSSPTLIFVFLLLYSISSIMFCFLVSVFFSKANVAAVAGGFLWFLSYTPYNFIAQSYDTMSLGLKIASCLLSNCCMSIGSLLIGKFEGRGTGVQWSNIYEGVSVDDDMTLGYVLLMYIADILLYGIITWYIEAVFPGEYGTPQPWYFPCTSRYWCGVNKQLDAESNGVVSNGVVSSEFLEKDPSGLHAGIKVQNIKKSFSTEKGEKVAVDGVNLNMYQGQITALLGHNGAGKTTLMSMLTGLFSPTSGTALVNDCNIIDNMAGARSSLGLCPQHDVLFDRLTVEEHLWFFAMLKGCPRRRVQSEIDKMIDSVGLSDKRHVQTRALSGGMKRKLSVGIALISGSKVVMLDEPTSGMDPSARRFTWDLLQQQRQDRTILLTTHFMDEADFLGDRIAIMAEGQIKCCGSSLFLKNKYGVGYHMAIVKATLCDVPLVNAIVQKYVPTAQLESNIGAELTFILPSEATGNFEPLFTELESRRQELGINSFGVSVTTMEEVFLKVGEEMDDSLTKALQNEETDTINNGDDDDDNDFRIEVDDTNTMGVISEGSCQVNAEHNCNMQLGFQRWYAMFIKRFLHSKRNRLSIIPQLLLPLIFTLFALISAKTFPQPGDAPPLALNTTSFGKNFVPFSFVPNNRTKILAKEFKDQFKGTDTKAIRVNGDMSHYLLKEPDDVGQGDFNLRYLVAASFTNKTQETEITAWFNNQPLHAVAITLATVHNGLIKAISGENSSLTTINHPLPRTTKDTIDDLKRNGLGFLISFNVLFGMAFLASSFVVFLVQERSNKAKHVQFVSGIDPLSYWTSAYVWDLINYLVPALSLLILLAAFDVPAYNGPNLGYTFLLLMIYGWAIIPLMYLFSFVFTTAVYAFVVLTIFNIVTGLATLMTVFILEIPGVGERDAANVLKWVFLILPNYCLGQGLGDIFNNYNTLSVFNQAMRECKEMFPYLTIDECKKLIKEKAGDYPIEFQENYLSWENPGIGRYLVFMAWEGIFFFLLVLLFESGLPRRFYLSLRSSFSMSLKVMRPGDIYSSSVVEDDDDVFAEKRRVAVGSDNQDVLVIRELSKVYPGRRGRGPLIAVNDLSLGVPLGECFGLLGVNGAGKTTTFRMLTGDEMMTSGTAVVDHFDIRSNMEQVRQRVFFCPQFDALIGHMTTREMLYMYARLRGVPEIDIPHTVENLMRSLLLSNHADKLTKSLSGGNKRKLSTAISLVGNPPVVFLDEPTTGMDPVAKRLLWNALCRVRADGRCIIITSHSMEECDALCTRLAIMVNGRFKCLGSPQHLKTKFGEGYTLILKIANPDQLPRLKEYIEEVFPRSILKDEHLGMVHYHITDMSISWAKIFGEIERIKLDYDIEDYTISQTSLEQVFLNFARGQRLEDQ
uniref:ATP-binding cassette sub-family A member 3-like isoform X2 n=1 Tax=Actinia tenebrosa TaxID=6105 RepID=A0A6P8HMV1_ACTTE